jgi:hypothetical protein
VTSTIQCYKQVYISMMKVFWFLFVLCLFPIHSFSLDLCVLLWTVGSMGS